jgi:hypothetical protein
VFGYSYMYVYNGTSQNHESALGPKEYVWFREMVSFVRLLLQRNVLQGLNI